MRTQATDELRQPLAARHFRRKDRLLNAAAFSSVFDGNDFRVSHKYALLLAKTNTQALSRLGMVIGKKNARLAVDRHRIKRIVREQFRLQRELFTGFDVVVIARSGIDTRTNAEIAVMVIQLIQSVQQQRARKQKYS